MPDRTVVSPWRIRTHTDAGNVNIPSHSVSLRRRYKPLGAEPVKIHERVPTTRLLDRIGHEVRTLDNHISAFKRRPKGFRNQQIAVTNAGKVCVLSIVGYDYYIRTPRAERLDHRPANDSAPTHDRDHD